jgi:MIP family channel proteins
MQRYLSEFLGTFILILTGCGAIAVNSWTPGEPQFVGIGIIWGLIVMAVIFTIGDISGAHINPAVTIAFWAARRFSALDVVPYILAQCLGAIAAAGVLRYLFDDHANAGVTHFNPEVFSVTQAFVLEVLLTWFLMFTVINVSTGAKEKGITAAIAIGGVISIDVLFGGKVTGASMNPARSLGPALVSGDLDQLWVYIAGPIIGAILAIGCAAAIRPGVCCPPDGK